jgi:hypothetical protein
MNLREHALSVALASLTLAVSAGVAQAQTQAPASSWRSFVSVSPVFEDADLDGGGDFSVAGAIVRLGSSTGFGAGNRVGLTLNYDYADYSFENPVAFGGMAPWKVVQRYGFSVPMSFALEEGWNLGVSPSMDWFRENGADTGESLVWGATLSASKRFEDGNFLGLGLAAFSGLEENRFFPFPIVNWRFSPRWQLINPLAAGPTGPAGLEIDYLAENGWTVGVGAAWRKSRFRLSETGPVANGIGQVSGAPVFLRAARELGGGFILNLYAGVVFGGQLRVEDAAGNLLTKEDFGTAPIVGANLTVRF